MLAFVGTDKFFGCIDKSSVFVVFFEELSESIQVFIIKAVHDLLFVVFIDDEARIIDCRHCLFNRARCVFWCKEICNAIKLQNDAGENDVFL